MSNFNYTQALLSLIGSLTKSEKRYFKLYSQKTVGKREMQFITLFNIMDKHSGDYWVRIQKVIPDISAKQLSDLKRHLYQRLCECLRVYNTKHEDFRISAQIDIAKVLYNKGLFLDSLHTLAKAKEMAKREHQSLLMYQIIDFEKSIESRHITRSHSTRVQELERDTDEIRMVIRAETDWSEFALKLYNFFIQKGHVKNRADLEEIVHYAKEHQPPIRKGSKYYFFERLYQCQALQWYNFIIQNFVESYKYSKSWVDLFEEFPLFKKRNALLYIKGIHNCLSVLYYCMDVKRHEHYLSILEDFMSSGQSFDANVRHMAFIYLNNARLNAIVLSAEFSQNKKFLHQLEQEIDGLEAQVDDYRLMIFWYKMASIYFTMGDYSNCIRLLNLIINPNQKKLREDLQCFARLLNIIAHFELGHDELLSYSIRSTYRFLLKMNEVTEFHRILIAFLKKALFKKRNHLKSDFIQLKTQYEVLFNDPYERRSFLFLDAISWLESKIENQSVEVVIRRKRRELLAL